MQEFLWLIKAIVFEVSSLNQLVASLKMCSIFLLLLNRKKLPVATVVLDTESSVKYFLCLLQPFGIKDTLGCYLDLDNYEISYSKNGKCQIIMFYFLLIEM